MECKHKNHVPLLCRGGHGDLDFCYGVKTLEDGAGCEDVLRQQYKTLCVCKDCGAVFVKEFMPEVAESESEKTGEKMLKKLGYERKQGTALEVYVSRGSEGLDYIIRVAGDLCRAEYKADGQVIETSLTADEIHALHYLFKERGL